MAAGRRQAPTLIIAQSLALRGRGMQRLVAAGQPVGRGGYAASMPPAGCRPDRSKSADALLAGGREAEFPGAPCLQ